MTAGTAAVIGQFSLGALAAAALVAAAGALAPSGGSAAAQPPNGGLAPGISPYVPPAGKSAAQTPTTAAPAAANGSQESSPVPTSAPAAPAGSGPAAGRLDPVTKAYVLGAGDKLRIMVYGEQDMTGEYSVADNGELSFPLIGQVHAGGKTVEDVRNAIESALRQGYLKDPRVSAEVLTFRPYYILGEVAKPGEYPYSAGITAINAVATAGGFTYRANRKVVFIKTVEDAKERKVKLTDELQVTPGETLRVIERLF